MTDRMTLDHPDGFRHRSLRVFTTDARTFTVHDIRRAAIDILSRNPHLTLVETTHVTGVRNIAVCRLAIVPTGVAPRIELAPVLDEGFMLRPEGFHHDERLHAVAMYVPPNDRTEMGMTEREMARFSLDFCQSLDRLLPRSPA